MRRAVPTAVLTAAGLIAAACSEGGDGTSSAAETPPAPAPAGQAAPTGPALGGGRSLTGAVSGLQGAITGFAVRQTRTQTIVELAADVLFAFDSADLTPEATAALARTAVLIRAGGEGTVDVVGHTDSLGEDAYNLNLSRRRAAAVAEWLSSSGGIDASRLRAEGRGEAEPVAPNAGPDGRDDPEGRARNRRVVVTIPR